MPAAPRPLPPELRGAAFSVADARRRGVSADRLRASDLAAPFYGVRVEAGELTLVDRCRARATRLPGFAAFRHTTAARLHALPLPPRLAQLTELHVSVPTGARSPRGAGTLGHHVSCRPEEADRRHGVLCTTPERTFCDLAALLSLGELVAVGDAILHRRLATADDLGAAAAQWPGRRGRPRLDAALELLDGRAESPKESELRIVLHDAGFLRPEVNHVVRDAAGRFVARVDLAYPARKVAIEYEGDHHRDKDQWRRDIARRRRLEALGWTVLQVTQHDLVDPSALLSDLSAALAR
jgi:very-short-patch-repair endonuclease